MDVRAICGAFGDRGERASLRLDVPVCGDFYIGGGVGEHIGVSGGAAGQEAAERHQLLPAVARYR